MFGVELLTTQEAVGILWFVIKTFGIAVLMLLPRGINPRIRIDILLRTGWAKLIAISFINIFIALALLYLGVAGPAGPVGVISP
jgi:NADH-quinone oxidoreductase subunit H